MNYKLLVLGILIISFIFVFLKTYFDEKSGTKYKIGTKQIVRVGIFGALSAILYIFIKFPVPLFPSFLEFHFDEVPVFIASFAYGPLSGFCVILIKTIIKLPFTTTLGVGEVSDLLFSCAFVLPAAIIYKKNRKFKSVIVGLSIGCVLQLIISLIGNIYLMIPFYMNMMGFSEDAILGLCQMANPNITDVGWTYGLFAVLPFNAIKDSIVIVLTLLSYKSVHRFIDKLQA